MDCSLCQYAVTCVSCSRFRVLRNSQTCKLLAYYHLYHHDMLDKTGTVEHKKDANREVTASGCCLTVEEIWNAEHRPDAG